MKTFGICVLLFAALPFAAIAAEEISAKGVVKKIDPAAGVVRLAHEPIPAIKWPAMVMNFKVREAKLLAGLKTEQKVNFGLVKAADGQYQLARIEVAP